MIVLGVDPGSQCTGYGVIACDGSGERLLHYGALRLDRYDEHALRLKKIYDGIAAVAERYCPDECAIEMPVYGKNPQSMLKLGRAQAAAMIAVLNRDIPVTEYTPKEVKKAVTGQGNASKEQVRYMVRALLSIRDAPDQETMGADASDALAVGLCHIHRHAQGGTRKSASWKSFLRDNPNIVVEDARRP